MDLEKQMNLEKRIELIKEDKRIQSKTIHDIKINCLREIDQSFVLISSSLQTIEIEKAKILSNRYILKQLDDEID